MERLIIKLYGVSDHLQINAKLGYTVCKRYVHKNLRVCVSVCVIVNQNAHVLHNGLL